MLNEEVISLTTQVVWMTGRLRYPGEVAVIKVMNRDTSTQGTEGETGLDGQRCVGCCSKLMSVQTR